jgi:MFS family permease
MGTEKLWSKDYIFVVLAGTGLVFCNYLFFAAMPVFAQSLTGSVAYAGLVITVFTIPALFSRPIAGILSDKYGRTTLLIVAAVLCAIACLLYNFVSILIMLLLVRALHGIGFGIHSTCAGAVVPDVVPKSRLAEGVGLSGILNTFAIGIAPGVALTIIGQGDLQNFRMLFMVALGMCVVSLILDCGITYERKNKKLAKNNPTLLDNTDKVIEKLPPTFLGFEYAVFPVAIVLLLLYTGISSINSFIFLFAIERQLGNIGLFFTFLAVGLFFSRLLMGRVADKYGADVIIIPGLIVFAVCFLLIPFAKSPIYLYLISFPFGIAQGAVPPVMNAMLFKRCSDQRRGTASAAFFASIDIGYAFGSLMFGVIAASFNYYFVYGGAMVCTVFALGIYLAIVSEKGQIMIRKKAS